MHHESCTDLFSVSERSPVVFQNLDGLNVYTQVPQRAPASCTTFLLCLCKSFKELFLQCLAQQVLSESGCKGTTFFRTCKLFRDFFRWKRKVFGLIDSITGYTLFIIKARSKRWEMRGERLRGNCRARHCRRVWRIWTTVMTNSRNGFAI